MEAIRWIIKTAIATSDLLCNSDVEEQSNIAAEGESYSFRDISYLELEPFRRKQSNGKTTFHLIVSNDLNATENETHFVDASALAMNNNALCYEDIWKELDPSLADNESLTVLSFETDAPPVPTEVRYQARQATTELVPPKPFARTAPRRTPKEGDSLSIVSSLGSKSGGEGASDQGIEEDTLFLELLETPLQRRLQRFNQKISPPPPPPTKRRQSSLPNIVESDGESSSTDSQKKNLVKNRMNSATVASNMRKAAKAMGERSAVSEATSCVFSVEDEREPNQPRTAKLFMTNGPKNDLMTSKSLFSETSSTSLFSCEELRSTYMEAENEKNLATNEKGGIFRCEETPAPMPNQPQPVSPPSIVRQQGRSSNRQPAPNTSSASVATDPFDSPPKIDSSRRHGNTISVDDDDDDSSFLVPDALKKWNPKFTTVRTDVRSPTSFTYSSMESENDISNRCLDQQQARNEKDDQGSSLLLHDEDCSSYSSCWRPTGQGLGRNEFHFPHSHDDNVLSGSRQIQLLLEGDEDVKELEATARKILYTHDYQHSPKPTIHRGHWFLPPNTTSTSCSSTRLSTPSQSPVSSSCASFANADDESI